MKEIVVKFGLIAGALLAIMMAVTIPLGMNGTIDFNLGPLFGYTSMVLAFLAVFFGVRSYRDKTAGGTITFGRAFKVGILIALIGCAIYVIGWQIVYWNFWPNFQDTYATLAIQNARESGATPAQIATLEAQMAQFKRWYKNPVLNVLFTFIEVFPVALIMSLISAAILRKKTPDALHRATAIA